MQPSRRILIMAGGTGGHVFPALAVAKQLRERGHEVMWLGTHQGMECQWVAAEQIPLFTITLTGVRRHGIKRLLTLPFTLVRSSIEAAKIIRRCQPDVVLGMGGYASAPGGVMARLLGKRLIIHEQNAIAGLTNRLLKPLANQVATAFPQPFRQPSDTLCYIGNPFPQALRELPTPTARLRRHDAPLQILVLGGSRGALSLNRSVPAAIAKLPFQVNVRHQCGQPHLAVTTAAYQQASVTAEIIPFIDDMVAAYGLADLVICRAGAMTVTELMAVGLPSILIPYPHAVDDHQTLNAKFLVDKQAAQWLPESELSADRLSQMMIEMSALEKRVQMAENARALCRMDATSRLVDLLVNDTI